MFLIKYISHSKVLALMNRTQWQDEDEVDDVGNLSPGNYSLMPSEREEDLLQRGKDDGDTMVEVSVSIWFTSEFAAIEEDIQGYVNTLFEEANGALVNSKVPMRLRHHGTRLYEGEELSTTSDMLDAFAETDDVLKSADTSFLLTSTFDKNCGRAFSNSVSNPVAVARHSCARYSTG